MTAEPFASRKAELVSTLRHAQVLASAMTTADAGADASLEERLQVEGQRMQQFTAAFTLAFIADEPTPISMYRAWASYSQFRKWEQAGKLSLSRKNRKVCVRPSQFFEFWRSQ